LDGWAHTTRARGADIEHLIDTLHGNTATIARALGCSRQTVMRRIDRSPTLKAKLEDAREGMIDQAESALYARVLAGHIRAIIFFFRTRGKARGHTERQELTVKDGDPLGRSQAALHAGSDAVVDAIRGRPDAPAPQPGDDMPRGFLLPEQVRPV
jgi:hypothetical protein